MFCFFCFLHLFYWKIHPCVRYLQPQLFQALGFTFPNSPFQIQARHGQAHGQSWYFSPAVLTTSPSCPLLAMDTSITPNYLILPPWACSASPTAPCKAIKSPWVTLMMLTEHKLALTSFPSLTPSVNITANPFAYSFSNEHSNSPVSPSLPLST